MKPDPCPVCGANRNFVGRVHCCVPSSVANAYNMANHVANSVGADVAMANESGSTYRYRDPEKRRVYQRDLMRRKRAAARVAQR